MLLRWKLARLFLRVHKFRSWRPPIHNYHQCGSDTPATVEVLEDRCLLTNLAPTLELISDQNVCEESGTHTLALAGISAGTGESQPLRVTANSSGNDSFGAAADFAVGAYQRSVSVGDFNGDSIQDLAVANRSNDNVSILLGEAVIIPVPTVTYTSGESMGSLQFTTVPGQNGTATITVTVEDGGLDGDLNTAGDNATFSHTFDVTVTPGNLAWARHVIYGAIGGADGTRFDDANNDGLLDISVG